MTGPAVVLSIYDDVGNPHYGGGGATVVREVAERLAVDHRVTVYTGSYRGSGRRRVRGGVRYVFLPVGWAGPRAGQLLFSLVLPLVALGLRAARRGPDVWIESLTPPFTAGPLPLVAGWPVVGLVQMLSGADMQRRYGLPFAAVERRGLRLYRRLVVLNEVDAAAVRECAPRAQVTLVPNGVRLPRAVEADGGGDHILVLGRVDVRQKGLDLLLAAVAAAPPGLPLTLAGAGTAAEEAALTELITRTGVPVRRPGRVEGAAKDELLRSCALVVVPSRYETFSLTALEAMAHGKPVVCFDLPQLSWIKPDAAVRVPAFDAAALGAALRDLAADPARRAELGRAGRRQSAEHDWAAVAARYRALVAEATAA